MCQTRKVVKHTQTIRRLLPPDSPNCLSVFDHFAGLAFKGLNASLLPSNYPFSRTMYKATVNSVKSSIGFIKGNAK